MKSIEAFVLWLWINIWRVLTLWLPKKNKRIAFVSYFSQKPSRDFQLVSDALLKRGYSDIVFLGQKFTGGIKSKFKYLVGIIRQVYLFNTCGAFIIDGNSPVACFIQGKHTARSIQLWHAAGAFKKFGVDTERKYKLKGYDAVIVTSQSCRRIYADALNTPIENVFALGKARTDILFKEPMQYMYLLLAENIL